MNVCTNQTGASWCGDFSTNDFTQYINYQCGARPADDARTISGAGACPGGKQLNPAPTEAGVAGCPDPGDRGCRFLLVDAPANILSTATFKPKGKAARLRVAPRRVETDDRSGDTGWFITQDEKPGPWGGDPRNELVMAKQQTNSGVGAGYYGQNDEAFYGWSTFIPVVGQPGDDLDHTFVLHVVWSVCDCIPSPTESCDSPKQRCGQGQDPGKVELWVDDASTRSYPKIGDPENRPTPYRWPQSTAYTSTGPYSSTCPNGLADESTDWADNNSPMPVYLKTGAYRSKDADWTETVFNADLRIGPTKESVDPRLR